MATILAQKATTDTAVAKSDDHHEVLAADPTIPQFPQGSTYGTTSTTNTTAGFGSSSGFGAPASGFNQNSFNSPSFNTQPNSGFGSTQNINQSTGQQPVLTGAAATNAASGADVLVANDKESEHWINSKWRPAMGWLYMSTCFADFILFPILWSLLQALNHGQVTSQWQPLTLQGAGLYHIAMGAVLGIAAYGRTKEKVAGAN
jgi:Holin of 3TMs, for gene-transfer release